MSIATDNQRSNRVFEILLWIFALSFAFDFRGDNPQGRMIA